MSHWFARMLDLFPPPAGVVPPAPKYPAPVEANDQDATAEDHVEIIEENLCTTETEEKLKTATKL